ncbi:AraC family transcriptional regulator [Pedobacter cryoconitis]|uniref:AraC-like DNA-binding protein n=1 Tax=Pedobacter cryoconitis TaxID=188932 RepID=A0A327STI5_9SPHI|nr:helix-turn-helix transcriptional regulator [Pedobacter cryoconitis]RAJ32218.1 AraC-like DNA-binding protein [Pedobacter cryoconitis]
MKQSKDKRTSIPVHKLQERTSLGIQVRYFVNFNKQDIRKLGAHRDDHYILIIQEYGNSKVNIDFKTIMVSGCAAFFILPGQVHYVPESEETAGWFMAIDSSLVDKSYQQIFEELALHQQALAISTEKVDQLAKCAGLLCDMFDDAEQALMPGTVIHSLASAYVGIFADLYKSSNPEKDKQNLRPEIITSEFRKLVSSQFKTLKNPSQYADTLSLSLSYLNEVVKAVTGFPVSYWIHQEIILEAKRMLYYSDLSVKQIAFSLGYDDHAYFSRLFTKVSGISAVRFRKDYRE